MDLLNVEAIILITVQAFLSPVIKLLLPRLGVISILLLWTGVNSEPALAQIIWLEIDANLSSFRFSGLAWIQCCMHLRLLMGWHHLIIVPPQNFVHRLMCCTGACLISSVWALHLVAWSDTKVLFNLRFCCIVEAFVFAEPRTAIEKCHALKDQGFQYHKDLPNSMLVFLIGLAIGPSQPLIIVFVLVYALLSWLATRHNVLYVYSTPYDSCGAIWGFSSGPLSPFCCWAPWPQVCFSAQSECHHKCHEICFMSWLASYTLII